MYFIYTVRLSAISHRYTLSRIRIGNTRDALLELSGLIVQDIYHPINCSFMHHNLPGGTVHIAYLMPSV